MDKSIASSLVRVKWLALMLMGNFRIKTPTAGLEVISYIPLLHLFIESEAAMKFRRIQGHLRLTDSGLKTTTLNKRGHRFICRGYFSKLGVAEEETDEIPTTMVWNRRFSVIEYSFAQGKPVKTVDLDFHTDGAFTSTSAGAAVVVVNREGLITEEEAIYLGRNSSAYPAEILAIKSATELIQLRWPEYRVITLYSYCQAALKAVGQNFVKSQLVLDTIAALNKAARNNIIHLRWVKGHCGIISNERADVLAKEGASDPLREAAQIRKLPLSVIKSLNREGLELWWNEYPTRLSSVSQGCCGRVWKGDTKNPY